MSTSVTDGVLKDLSALRAANGCAVSLYVDLDPSSVPTPPDVETKFNSLFSELEKLADRHGAERDCRLALQDDLAKIQAWWADLDRAGARGVAVFASSANGYFRALALPEAVGDAARIGSELFVAPLAGQLGRDGALVAFVSRERGTVYRFAGGRLEEIIDESEEQPGQHDQGGWSQARYQRHIEQLVQEHLRAVGSEIDRTVRGSGGLQLVGVGPDEIRTDFERALSHEARQAIVGWTTAEAHAGPNELIEIVRPLLDEARARQDEDALERWQEAHGRGERSAAGWKQVLDAASDGRIDVLLVEGVDRPAWQCPQCGRASADGGKCPLDGTKLDEAPDGTDLAIHRTLANGGTIVRLAPGALGDAEGLAALLRY